MKKNYIFTNKKHSEKSIMSTILGLIAVISPVVAVFFSFEVAGEARFQYGLAVFFSMLFALAGLVLGIMSRMEKDKFYLFSYVGIILNVLALAEVSIILYAGVM
ncbi:MAG: DUF6142 family protein [Lachnospiraceae bacterium]|nr:DUF6142 family protein [Lachnospiraceae bacterium]